MQLQLGFDVFVGAPAQADDAEPRGRRRRGKPVAVAVPLPGFEAASVDGSAAASVSVTVSVPVVVPELADGSGPTTPAREVAAPAPELVAPAPAPELAAPALAPLDETRSTIDVHAAAAAVAAARPRILIFDVETTGTDKKRDQIIELCVQTGLEDDAPSRTWRFRPTAPIHPGAQAVHGIGMEDLVDCPRFAACADEVAEVFAGCDVVVGYNLAFDIDMLQAEYERAGRPPIDFSGKTIVDAFRLWQQCEPRSLQHAHRRFVGDGFAAAHSASADVAATGRVLRGMIQAFDLVDRDWGAIATVCDPLRSTWIGPSRHLRWDGDAIVFGFGKHAGTPVAVLARESPDYLEWVMNKDFPGHVGDVCRAALQRDAAQLAAWVREKFGSQSA